MPSSIGIEMWQSSSDASKRRADEPRELTMIVRSASSGPAQALILKARDLAHTGIAAKVIVAKLDPEEDVRKLYACLSQLKPRGRAHELIRWCSQSAAARCP